MNTSSLLLLGLLVSLPSIATAAEEEAPPTGSHTWDDATVQLCQDTQLAQRHKKPVLMGCADRVLHGDKSYLLDYAATLSTGERARIKNQLKKLRSDSRIVRAQVTVSGETKREDGHFPNPMAIFDVFRVESLTLNPDQSDKQAPKPPGEGE